MHLFKIFYLLFLMLIDPIITGNKIFYVFSVYLLLNTLFSWNVHCKHSEDGIVNATSGALLSLKTRPLEKQWSHEWTFLHDWLLQFLRWDYTFVFYTTLIMSFFFYLLAVEDRSFMSSLIFKNVFIAICNVYFRSCCPKIVESKPPKEILFQISFCTKYLALRFEFRSCFFDLLSCKSLKLRWLHIHKTILPHVTNISSR